MQMQEKRIELWHTRKTISHLNKNPLLSSFSLLPLQNLPNFQMIQKFVIVYEIFLCTHK